MHYYQFNIGDYRRDTSHLSLLEHGVYRSLIDSYYMAEHGLIADDAQLMRTHSIRNADEQQAYKNVISDFFTQAEGVYKHTGCDKQLTKILIKSDKARKSAGFRWDKHANAMRTHNERNANGMLPSNLNNPITPVTSITQEPSLKDLVPNKLGTEVIFEEVWQQWPSKKNKKKALVSFQSYITKKKVDPIEFGKQLKNDICKRCDAQQLGFDMMHFTTYINGERFNDDYSAEQNSHAMIEKYVDTLDFSDVPR